MSITGMSNIPDWNDVELSMYLLDELGGNSSSTNRDYLANLTSWLTITPKYTVYRVNTLAHRGEEVQDIIYKELSKQAVSRGLDAPSVFIHEEMPEVVLMDSWDVASLNLSFQDKEVIVDIACGVAVLRGAHVFAPGIKGMSRDTASGDYVSVFADVKNKCTRGLICSFTEEKFFVGNGIVRIGRNDLFGKAALVKGIAIEMIDIRSAIPSLPLNCIPDSYAMLQNLPSVLSCRALAPSAGEIVLDMCAAPGNKTTHLAMLMNNKGTVIAIDKTSTKVDAIKDRCQQFGISCVKSFVFDSTKAVLEVKKPEDGTVKIQNFHQKKVTEEKCEDLSKCPENIEMKPPFPPETFDKILLDAPCSAMGQRPQIISSVSLKQLKSYPPLQRKLFQAAVTLLKRGGHLVYSTCTITVAENEHLIKWALNKFPYLELAQVESNLGGPGLENMGLTEEQRQYVKRFGPPMNSLELYYDNYDYNQDTVGFFIAHFVKK
ncbi:hypothetical protein R5R35_009022 [Gryllus longicercus]|uniref:SAM-dependent MTase RsmB/NOP-type domain-containing protein n=1 Tax=Gryllus longicercus TaxID=2509291 RepID=A0AAN9W4K6_9ORTH